MVAERRAVESVSPMEWPKTPGAIFLHDVFEESKEMLEREKSASEIAKIGNIFVRRWQDNSLTLVTGLILRSNRDDYGLVLGKVGFGKDPESGLTFEFGKLPNLELEFPETLNRWSAFGERKALEEKQVSYLDALVHQDGRAYGSGRFYLFGGTTEVDCWVDRREHGGSEVGRYPHGENKSSMGVMSYVDVVRPLAELSWR